MRTPTTVLWSQIGETRKTYPVLGFLKKSDLVALRPVVPSSSEKRETERLREALTLVARLLWAEKVQVPLTTGEAFHSHLITMTGAVAHLASESHKTDTDTRRRRLAAWLWSATLARHPTQLQNPEQLNASVRELAEWLRNGEHVPQVIADAQVGSPTVEGLLRERSIRGPLFRTVLAQLYKREVRDLQTGEPIEVGLHFDEHPEVDHVFARAWCRELPEEDREGYDSIVNKTPLSWRTNVNKSKSPPSAFVASLQERGVSRARLDEFLDRHLISIDRLEADDFAGFKADRAARLQAMLADAVRPPV